MGVSEEQSSKRLPFCTIDCMEGKEMGTIFGWHIRKFMSGVLNSQYKVLMPLIAVLAYCWLGKLPVYASTVPGCFPQLCCLMLVCFFSFTFTFTSLPFLYQLMHVLSIYEISNKRESVYNNSFPSIQILFTLGPMNSHSFKTCLHKQVYIVEMRTLCLYEDDCDISYQIEEKIYNTIYINAF